MISEIFESVKGTQLAKTRTICEIHREIFDRCIIEFNDRPKALKNIIKLLEEAFVVGIKINKRLVELKAKEIYEKNDWMKNKTLREDRIRLMKMLNHNLDFLKQYA